MHIHAINFKFFPKYQFLFGVNMYMHQTHSLEDNKVYSGIDFELGIGLFVLTIEVLKKKKGAN